MARRFTFKKVSAAPESTETIDYRKQLLIALRQPAGPSGVTYEEAAARLPLIQKIMDHEDDDVVLEEAEWVELCDAFKRLKFTLVLEGVVRLGEDLLNAPTVELTPVKGNGKER